ncbi:MAG TPA: PIG-L family deacetylase, partial [Holophagaceae bacterium]|nr:PIG-L family deacetylase [Holophagaceae bacterium]
MSPSLRLLNVPTCAVLLACAGLQAQAVKDAADLQKALDKLQVLGSVLYVAAHPDDENTAALTTFSKGRNLRTAYLAMTRGGGGQNLIGPELGDGLAAIRTQELRAARRIDGAEQYFTSAVDFGYSKSADESLRIWNHDRMLAEVVYRIRAFRPDVIITRFDPTDLNTHGHHRASAMLAVEAFTAAADPKRFPEQLATVRPWQAQRLFWNTYHTFMGGKPDPSEGTLTLDLGVYDPVLGKSYAELAAESRSQHRSQGFGEVARRGARPDYFKQLAGSPAKVDPFEGLDLGWTRVPGGRNVASLLREARMGFRADRPAAILPLLHRALLAVRELPAEAQADPLVQTKVAELEETIRAAAGLWVEAVADRASAAPGDTLTVNAAVVAREAALTLDSLTLEAVTPEGIRALETRTPHAPLPGNAPRAEAFTFT